MKPWLEMIGFQPRKLDRKKRIQVTARLRKFGCPGNKEEVIHVGDGSLRPEKHQAANQRQYAACNDWQPAAGEIQILIVAPLPFKQSISCLLLKCTTPDRTTL
ncbi:hypothetical protein [Labrenzia sp. CP4]|uniref:hypothetical protein n=1 Tax=Labrenzia sp. CP4 TaxID=1674922 RepID=UPI0011A4E4CF|nr:hypothetical protein [Labrenzia sp. CP4]